MESQESDIRWSELVKYLAGLTNQSTVAAQVGVNPKEIGRWIRGEAKPQGERARSLIRACGEYGVNWRRFSQLEPVYDFRREYVENLTNGPQGLGVGDAYVPPLPTRIWDLDVNSCLGIPASVLTINSGWIGPFCRLGFDVFTYKTCRSRPVKAHTFPNIVFLPELREPVPLGKMPSSTRGCSSLPVVEVATISAANSFGMPSLSPQEWQADVRATMGVLQSKQILLVSVVGTVTDEDRDLVGDFVRCAEMAWEAKPHAIELNFSCPNVYAKEEGSIYQTPELAGQIVERVRSRLRDARIVAKIGYLSTDRLTELFKATYRRLDGYTAINTVPIEILSEKGEQVFPGNKRKKAGASGVAIKNHALETVRNLRRLASDVRKEMVILGTGGVSSAEDVKQMLGAGADAVQICTATMLNPQIAVEIRGHMAGQQVSQNSSRLLDKAGLQIRFSEPEIGLAFDNLLAACEEVKYPLDKAVPILQRQWLNGFAATLGTIHEAGSSVAKTRRSAPTKGQILGWLRDEIRRR